MTLAAQTHCGGHKYKLAFVQPSVQQRWEVLTEGQFKPHQFANRTLALHYARMWACVNRPSAIRISDPTGGPERQWVFS
jgi:hypothetical protein